MIITDRHVTLVTRDNSVDFEILTGDCNFQAGLHYVRCDLNSQVTKKSDTTTLGPRITRELEAILAAPHRKEREVLYINTQCTDA